MTTIEQLREELVKKFQSAEDGLAPQEITELLAILQRENRAFAVEQINKIGLVPAIRERSKPYLQDAYEHGWNDACEGIKVKKDKLIAALTSEK